MEFAALIFCCAIMVTAQQHGGTGASPETFVAQQIAQKLLDEVGNGLQSHNSRRMLSAFDRDGMQGYLTFQDQVQAFFSQYESFRIYSRLEESSLEQDKGTATAVIQLEAVPRDGGQPIRREGEITIEFRQGRGGWKIVDVAPRNFFS